MALITSDGVPSRVDSRRAEPLSAAEREEAADAAEDYDEGALTVRRAGSTVPGVLLSARVE